MKIKKIEIRNIASIEDATIDFTQTPLRDADIFLITGITGSGKSTILDAICLALYRRVPRIEHLSGTSVRANSDELTQNDPRNMMRLQTGEAYVRLQFEGNDGRNYEAEWSVQRGKRKKIDALLSNYVWSLSELRGDEKITIESGDKRDAYLEVEKKVIEVVGLNFEQFCRTTLLAQGQFTKFLQSTEKEKSAILEKITGTGIYSQIGATIYRIKGEKELAYSQQLSAFEAIKVLGEEERRTHEQEQIHVRSNLDAKNGEQNDLVARINWLKIKANDTKRLAEAHQRLLEAQSAISSEEFARTKATIEAWHDTLAIRQVLLRSSEKRKEWDQLLLHMEQLHQQYKRCMSGWTALQLSIQQQQKDCNAMSEQIDAERHLISIYNNVSEIYSTLMTLDDKMAERVEKLQTMTQADEQLRALQALQKEQQRAYELAAEQLTQLTNLLRQQEELLQTIPHQHLREQLNTLRELVRCNIDIKQYATTMQTLSDELNAIDLLPCEQELAQWQEQLRQAIMRRDFCELSVNEAATMLRTHLHERLGSGDCVCPVCKQQVDALPADAMLSQTVMNLREECKHLEQQKNLVEQRYNQLKLRRSSLQTQIDYAQKQCNQSLQAKQELLRSLVEELRAQWEAATQEELLLVEEQLKQQLTQYEEQCALRDSYQRQCNEAQNRTSDQLKALTETNTKLAGYETTYKMTQRAIEDIDSAMRSSCTALQEQLLPLQVDESEWREHPKKFAWRLRDRCDKYHGLLIKLEDMKRTLSQSEQEHRQIQDIYHAVRAMRVDWGEEFDNSAMLIGLQSAWIKLQADLSIALDKETEIRKTLRLLEQEWLEFQQTNPTYDLQRIDELNRVEQSEYERMDNYVKACNTECSSAQLLYDESLTQLQQHEQDPLMHPATATPEDDPEQMKLRHEQIEQEKLACVQRLLELNQLLQQDDLNRQQKNDTEHLKLMYNELEQWKKLCSIFGGSDSLGSKMRMIAQSFILSTLLDAANYHLQRMSDRYRLLVIDGTLDMKLEDRYQGYATRNVHSISGGESFMVSLSLALALADFGQGMGVETLFIDEGFGTLSGEHLQKAVNVLQSLHTNMHRQVGIISHREEIREHIPVQICVDLPNRSSASRITVVDRAK